MDSAISAELEIEAAKTEKRLLQFRSSYPSLVIQIVSTKNPPGAAAVRMIAMQTLRARETDALLADRPEVDLLLRLAGTNQITVALKTHGYKGAGTKLLVAAGPRDQIERLRSELSGEGCNIREEDEPDEEGLSAVELAALLGTRT